MKKQFIGHIRSGDVMMDCFVLTEKSMAQKKDGNKYLNLVLSDRTGSIKGVVWDNVETISSQADSGAVWSKQVPNALDHLRERHRDRVRLGVLSSPLNEEGNELATEGWQINRNRLRCGEEP